MEKEHIRTSQKNKRVKELHWKTTAMEKNTFKIMDDELI